jgi:hypothetical protein
MPRLRDADLAGRYFYSDYCTPFVDTFVKRGGCAMSFVDKTASSVRGRQRLAFGQDAAAAVHREHGGSVAHRAD